MVERWTVRPWGADGPPANFKVVPETMFVSGGAEHITTDGSPLGSGRSAPVPESLLNSSGNLNWLVDSPAQVGGRSATLTQNVPERVFSLVGAMIYAADGPPLG